MYRPNLTFEVNRFDQIYFVFVFFQGHDTTGAAMSWFLYCMAAHPEYQVHILLN